MATYVTLVILTDQGVKNVREWGEKIQEAMQIGAALGVRFQPYLTMGLYDFILRLSRRCHEVAQPLIAG
jgi:uncharacterized protein with GYD domain